MEISLLFLTIITFILLTTSQHCIHDQISHKISIKNEPENIIKDHVRLLQSQHYSSIRINVSYEGITSMSLDAYNFVKQILMPEAIAFFSSTLRVIPYPGLLNFEQTQCNMANIPDFFINIGSASDFVLFLTPDNSQNVFAWSSVCIQSSIQKRPLAAQLNINPNFLNITQTPDSDQAGFWSQLSVILHEMTHILGFSNSLYNSYIGTPTITKSVTLRDMNTQIVTLPQVAQKARMHFGCTSLLGLELENQGITTGNMTSHWERRVLGPEIMTSLYSNNPVYSYFTLGMLEATGWYTINYSLSQPLIWGANKGCDFINKNCINLTFQAAFPEFCSNINVPGCTYDGTSKAICKGELGSPFLIWNYFDDNTTSPDPYSDNCPYFMGDNDGDCRIISNRNNSSLLYDEYYGPNSRCFAGTFIKNAYSEYFDGKNQKGACFESQCIIYPNSSIYYLNIIIKNITVKCPQKGGAMLIPNYMGYIICPDAQTFCIPTPICPNKCSNNGYCLNGECQCFIGFIGTDCSMTYCPVNCSGNGYCNQNNNTCICNTGWTDNDCSKPTLTVNCTACLGLLDCYKDKCECYPFDERNCTNLFSLYYEATDSKDKYIDLFTNRLEKNIILYLYLLYLIITITVCQR